MPAEKQTSVTDGNPVCDMYIPYVVVCIFSVLYNGVCVFVCVCVRIHSSALCC